MNRSDVIDVLSIVNAATRRTASEIDVDVWQAVIGDDHRDDAMRAVRDHLRDQPGIWLEPGHVHQRCRAIVRDRLAREPLDAKTARMDALAAKAADDIADLAARKQIPGSATYRRTGGETAVRLQCPWCHAAPGQPCVDPSTGRRLRQTRFHPTRVEAAMSKAR